MPNPRTPSLRRLLITHEAMFIVLVVVTGGVGAFWGWQWQQWSAESIRLNGLSHIAQEIRSRLFKQIQEVSVAGLREDPSARELNAERARATQELFNELRRRSRNRAEDYAVQGMQTAFGHLQANLRGALDDPFALNRLVRAKLFDPAFEQRFVAEFESAFESFGGLVNQQLAAQEDTIHRWTRFAPYALTGPILVGFGLLLFSRRSLTREFIEPMRKVLEGMREVSGGNLQHKLDAQGGREVRDLANGINRMAAELEASRDAIVAAERQAALGALVPVVAHNIRNPLAAIRANAQLLEGSESDEERGEISDDIIETVDRLDRWVNALVSYLHPLEARRIRIPARAVMDAALNLLEGRITQAGLVVRREPGTRPPKYRPIPTCWNRRCIAWSTTPLKRHAAVRSLLSVSLPRATRSCSASTTRAAAFRSSRNRRNLNPAPAPSASAPGWGSRSPIRSVPRMVSSSTSISRKGSAPGPRFERLCEPAERTHPALRMLKHDRDCSTR